MLNTKPITTIKDDRFGIEPFVDRLVSRIYSPNNTARLLAIYARWGSGKTSILNLCREKGSTIKTSNNSQTLSVHWLPVYETWKVEGVADLKIGLLWHIRNSLPDSIRNDEGILYRIGRLGVALSLTGLNVSGNLLGMGDVASFAIEGLEAADKLLPLGNNLATIDAFNKYEQAIKVNQAFDQLGEAICEKTNSNIIVVPVDDMDRLRPEAAVSLLFTMKNLLSSSHFCFLCALDRHAISKFLSLFYRSTFTIEDANWFLEKIFDDWADIPLPSLYNLFHELDLSQKFKPDEKQQFTNKIFELGLPSLINNPRRFIRGCQRFERFVNDSEREILFAENEYKPIGHLGFCLLYGAYPEQIEALYEAKGMGVAHSGVGVALKLLNVLGLTTEALSQPFNPSSELSSEDGFWKSTFKTTFDLLKSELSTSSLPISTYVQQILSSILKENDTNLTNQNLKLLYSQLLPLIPPDLQEYAQNPNSALMRFVRINSGLLEANLLSKCLDECMPYF